MNTSATIQFKRKLNKLVSGRPKLKQKIVAQTNRFKLNPHHPSLKTHKLSGNRADQYAFWIEANFRIIFIYSGGDVIFTDIVSHDRY